MMAVIGVNYASQSSLMEVLPDNGEWSSTIYPNRLFRSLSFANGTFIVTSMEGAYTNTVYLYNNDSLKYVGDYIGVYEKSGAAGDLLFIHETRNDLLVSSDAGNTWPVAVPANPYGFRDILYNGDGLFIAAGTRDYSSHDFPEAYGGAIFTFDRKTGTSIAYEVLPFDGLATASINSVAFGAGKYVAVGGLFDKRNYLNDDDFRSYIYTSDDAVKWKLVEQHFPYMLNDVVYVDGRFLARGITKNVQDDDGSGQPAPEVILTSTDGSSWTVTYNTDYPPGSDLDMDIAKETGYLGEARAIKLTVDGHEEIWVLGDSVIFHYSI